MLSVIDLQLSPEAESAAAARHSLNDLKEHLSSQQFEDVRLLVSELVTNAVRHAGLAPQEKIGFKVFLGTEFVRVEVHDSGPGFERLHVEVPSLEEIGGRGLYLVSVIADHWGNDSADRFCVWFEIVR